MPSPNPTPFRDTDVPATTKKGDRELKASGTLLSIVELELLVLIDGFSTIEEIAQRLPHISREDLAAALRKLADGKLIVSATEVDALGSGFSTMAIPAGFFKNLKTGANAEVGGAISILKKRGYYVRIARRHVEPRQSTPGWQPTILVIDDDADLQKLIRTYLILHGFEVRGALKNDEIAAALRQKPAPDLILLDVNLPDANGFDILARMRQHPVLKGMPVIMLTVEATREAVLKGLRGGADGYVTKPFEQDWLVSAVEAVLGLRPSAPSK